jgi:ABC-2 type transport system ATP-binding protein
MALWAYKQKFCIGFAAKEDNAMLEVQDLHKHFGAIRAVQGVSLTVEKGEVLGFLGPNGAGKTTTMRMITGFLSPSSGTARICGHDITADPVAAKRAIGYLPENAPAYDSMTVLDFLGFVAEIRGYHNAQRAERVETALARCRIDDIRHQSIGTLSKGYRQRVVFAQAILHDPPVLIMDEPTDGLDPNQKFLVRTMIRDMASEKAIIVSTHILEEVDAVCTRAVIIKKGRIVANGTPDALKAQSSTGRLEDVFRSLTLEQEGA